MPWKQAAAGPRARWQLLGQARVCRDPTASRTAPTLCARGSQQLSSPHLTLCLSTPNRRLSPHRTIRDNCYLWKLGGKTLILNAAQMTELRVGPFTREHPFRMSREPGCGR